MTTVMTDCYLSHNLGDDLFLTTLVSRYPHVQFVVSADRSYDFLREMFSNINLLVQTNHHSSLVSKSYWYFIKKYRHYRAIRSADVLVTIGGSLYWEQSGNKSLKARIDEARRLHGDRRKAREAKHHIVIGANFGPWHSDDFLNYYRDYFAYNCDDVCFRDRYSANLFSDIPTVHMAPDVLFGVQLPQVPKCHKAFFSVIDPHHPKYCMSSTQADAYDWMMVALMQRYAARGYELVLCSFCQAEGDERTMERLSNIMHEQGISVRLLRYRNDIREVLEELASSEVVVGSRFHATILGLSAGAAVLPVMYSAKTAHVLEDIGFDMGHTIDLKTDGWKDKPAEMLPEAICFDVTAQQAGAAGQFAALDHLVRGR